MRTVLAVMPIPGGQEEKIPWLQYAIENQRTFWRTSCNGRRAKDLPKLRTGDLKNNQIFVIAMAFEGAARTARHNRCDADLLQRVACDVLT